MTNMFWNLRVVVLALLLSALLMETAPAQQPGKVDLNTANLSQLDSLPGIGPAIAQRIIDFRNKNGPFRRIEDLMNVRGIGEKKFAALKDRVTVGSSSGPPRPASPPASKPAAPPPAQPKKP
jgi:competence ComEA-like helix-hairpin-helix protein